MHLHNVKTISTLGTVSLVLLVCQHSLMLTHLTLMLADSSHESSELLQWLCHNDSIINTAAAAILLLLLQSVQ